ncbi:TPA: ABC transporter ATP-binding protein [Staphylococcus aureus]|nr:ABC transporter ATP-binding protein [Staphylococcus aureus]HDB4635025.1 ABC transporter ATP-binding protein [Staphylococcus aureus]HDB4637812.1 ABC transporter ATP-binding protein [Staphylococcus aureus]HDB4640328.1 ABC transporter ATP-binding protein [Staphylococcus aureus]HDB4642740.1 ABC transporter ATP-binding protein [Staphylococcus aureus]
MNNQTNWIKILSGFASDSKWKIMLSILLSIISVFSGLVPYWAVFKIILMMINNAYTINSIMVYTFIALIAYISQVCCFGASTMLSHITAYEILSEIRKKLARKLMHLPLGVVESKKIGELKNIFVDKVETIELPLAHMIPEVIGNLLLSAAIFLYIMLIDWRMACALLVTIPIALFAFNKLMSGFNETYAKQMQSNNYMNSAIVEYIEGIEVIKTFNQSQSSYKKYQDAVDNYKIHTLNWFKNTWGYMNLGASVLPSTFLGILPVGMYLISINQLNYAEFFLCIVLSLGVVAPIKNFKNLSFTVPENHFTAIVGESGSGKSTIAKLISRYWDVTTGEITIGNVNIKNIEPKQLNELVGYVGQDNFLLNLTFKENIKLGNPEASDDAVVKAAKLAQCHEFIKKLPEGYDTNVGSVGDKLSGGEKQRVTIARMILKDAPIIVLDEATAYVDPDSEQKIQEALNVLTQDKTLIVIAHRLSTIQHADQIIVLGNQQILEKGSHQLLLKLEAHYKNMWDMHMHTKD